MSKKEAPAAPQVQLRFKGSAEFRHDLFKAAVQKFKKNLSYKEYTPELIGVEHCHFYHSHDNRGRKNQYTTAQGGHFHEITTEVTKSGEIVAKCGPALREIVIKNRSGKVKRVIEPVQYKDGDDRTLITDDHTHAMEYLHSEFLSEQKIQQIREGTQQALARLMAKNGQRMPTQQELSGGNQQQANDGVTLSEEGAE